MDRLASKCFFLNLKESLPNPLASRALTTDGLWTVVLVLTLSIDSQVGSNVLVQVIKEFYTFI